MKELRIPVPQDDIVEVSEISDDYKGIILCYNGEKAVGYIFHNYDTWYYNIDIDVEESMTDDDTLISLIKRLVQAGTCNRFKVVTFQ